MIYNELWKYDYFYLCIIRLTDSELPSTVTRRVLGVRRSAPRVVRSREYRVLLSLITSLVEQPQLGLQSFKLPHRLEEPHWENILATDGPGLRTLQQE